MRRSIKIVQTAIGLSFYLLALANEQLGLPVTPLVFYALAGALLSLKVLMLLNSIVNIQFFFILNCNPLAFFYSSFSTQHSCEVLVYA